MASGGSLRRNVNLTPTYLQPVTLPAVRVGQNARIATAEHRATIVRANRIIIDTRKYLACQEQVLRTGRTVVCQQ